MPIISPTAWKILMLRVILMLQQEMIFLTEEAIDVVINALIVVAGDDFDNGYDLQQISME